MELQLTLKFFSSIYYFLKKNSLIISFYLFIFSLFLLRLPPVYFLPIKISLFQTHSISKALILFSFIISFLIEGKKASNIPKVLKIILLIYFITQTLSIINAYYLQDFFIVFSNLCFALIFFIVSLNVLTNKKYISLTIYCLILTICINLVYQLFLFIGSDLFLTIAINVFYEKYWEVVLLNANRGKFFVDIYDAALIPFLVYFFITSKKIHQKIFFILLIFLEWIAVIASSFRIQLLVFSTSLISSILFTTKINRKKIFYLSTSLLFFLYLTFSFNSTEFKSTIDRLISPEEQDIRSIGSRVNWWQESLVMGSITPFGIGLGNYYYYVIKPQKSTSSFVDPKSRLDEITLTHPHNIFFATYAETGIFGLFSFLGLIAYFIYNDFKTFKKTIEIKISILSFWSLFIFSVLVPANTLQYSALFWVLRGIIIKYSIYV